MSTPDQIREAAERVLFGSTLEEKLQLAPRELADDRRGPAIALPTGPGRPPELAIARGGGDKAEFPGIHRIGNERDRGVMLHFLANHELLAAELMALVLLRFPEAPAAYRAGVYAAMREEQMHTLLYLRRMKECGIALGELPLNDYFWRVVAPMATPLDFVTRLNLTFEQANLDFSKYYASRFREAGDPATAAVLEKIYQDEIGHVGHGLEWFRRWKEPGRSDWEAFRDSPAPARAKGLAPYNREGRRLAGLDEDFIRQLEVYAQSRGRTPVVHCFHGNAEAEAMAAARGRPYQPDRTSAALDDDLELLSLTWARRDDIALVRRMPSLEHLLYLRSCGLELPEFLTELPEAGRKLGGLRPWAWSPGAASRLAPCAAAVSPQVSWQWREPLPPKWLSKEIGLAAEEGLGLTQDRGQLHREEAGAWDAVQSILEQSPGAQALVKTVHSHAGRGHRRINADSPAAATRNWLVSALRDHGAVVVEPWLERVLDFSSLYELKADGTVEWIGLTRMDNDAAGRFLGTRVAPKWSALLEPALATFLFREAQLMDWYGRRLPELLPRLLPGYCGPVGVDAMVHRRADGTLALKPVVEINVRMTMGRIALELLQKSGPGLQGLFRILRRDKTSSETLAALQADPHSILLNDPARATHFLALWQTLPFGTAAGGEGTHPVSMAVDSESWES